MAKAVRWIVPFQSLKGIQYEVRIYDNYDGTVPASWPVTLQGGASPISTDMDVSANRFEPIRSQSGTLHIADLDGTMIDQLLPDDNISRPVRMVSISGETETIEWQGFLSCDSYTQEYTSRAYILDISLLSTLQAMDSATILWSQDTIGEKSIRHAIGEAFKRMEIACGMSLFRNIYYSEASAAILNKKIDMTAFYDAKEQANESSVTDTAVGLSCLSILRKVAGFMGWCVSENGQDIYFQRIGEERGMMRQAYADFLQGAADAVRVTINNINMSSLEYRGTGHQREAMQGAKSVSVVADVSPYQIDMQLPECPKLDLYNRRLVRDFDTFTLNMSGASDTNSLIDMQCIGTILNVNAGEEERRTMRFTGEVRSIHDAVVNDIEEYARLHFVEAYYPDTVWTNLPYHMLSCFGIMNDENKTNVLCLMYADTQGWDELINEPDLQSSYIFRMRSALPFHAAGGKLVLEMQDEAYGTPLVMSLRVGDDYWVSRYYGWYGAFRTFKAEFTDKRCTIEMPISSMEFGGEVELAIYYTSGQSSWPFSLLSSIKLSYDGSEFYKLDDRGSNTYYRNLGTFFRDEVVLNLELATMTNNVPSPCLLLNQIEVYEGKFTKFITYIKADGTTEDRRPEKDLLNRASSYYSKARMSVSLETERLTYPLPLVEITGYDEKKYIPIAESRDWQTDTSTLTCIETPDGDE